MEKFSRRKIAFFGALAQALMWLFLIFVGSLYFVFNQKPIAPYMLILIYTF
jgi:hypothetical protein